MAARGLDHPSIATKGVPHAALSLCLVLVTVVVACRPTRCAHYEWGLANTGSAALHAVHSERLREIMRQLNRLALDRLPQEMDKRALVEQRLREFSKVGDAMAIAAARIPDALPRVELRSRAHREVFLELADQLRVLAVRLRDRAAQGHLRQSEVAYEQINATCNTCHSLFRTRPPRPDYS